MPGVDNAVVLEYRQKTEQCYEDETIYEASSGSAASSLVSGLSNNKKFVVSN